MGGEELEEIIGEIDTHGEKIDINDLARYMMNR
jgi:hypothetical protein